MLEVNDFMTGVHETDPAGRYVRDLAERQLVTQASYLKLYMSFERFLECSFIHYAMGFSSCMGGMAECFASPTSRDHAISMFKGLQRYTDWSDPARVRQLARIYFKGGEPFESALASSHSDLLDMKTIRNAAAHLSTSTSDQLEALILRRTGNAVPGLSAYDALMASSTGSLVPIFTECLYLVDGTAQLIWNHT